MSDHPPLLDQQFDDVELTEACWDDLFAHLDKASVGFARKWKERFTKLRSTLSGAHAPADAGTFAAIVLKRMEGLIETANKDSAWEMEAVAEMMKAAHLLRTFAPAQYPTERSAEARMNSAKLSEKLSRKK